MRRGRHLRHVVDHVHGGIDRDRPYRHCGPSGERLHGLLRPVEVQFACLPEIGLEDECGNRGKIFVIAIGVPVHASARGHKAALERILQRGFQCLAVGLLQRAHPRQQEPRAFEHADLATRRQKQNVRSFHQSGDFTGVPFQIDRRRRDGTQDPDLRIAARHVPESRSRRFGRDDDRLNIGPIGDRRRRRRRRGHQRRRAGRNRRGSAHFHSPFTRRAHAIRPMILRQFEQNSWRNRGKCHGRFSA